MEVFILLRDTDAIGTVAILLVSVSVLVLVSVSVAHRSSVFFLIVCLCIRVGWEEGEPWPC